MSRWITLAATFLCGALFAAPAAATAAGDVPISFRYEGTFTPPTVVTFDPLVVSTTDSLSGTGSHLGAFTATYPHLVNFTAGTFSGTARFTAANGDQLVVDLRGTGSPISPTVFSVSFTGTITGRTGRFEGAAGTLAGPGTVDLAALSVKATLEGVINREPQPF